MAQHHLVKWDFRKTAPTGILISEGGSDMENIVMDAVIKELSVILVDIKFSIWPGREMRILFRL
jgi:hypothetical protein